jgi:outer membrane protein assembly factor BamB
MRLVLATSLSLLLASPLTAEDSWTQFRGPNATGLSSATGLPTTWDEKTNVVWKTAIHGKGWSSPVVLGKQIWLTTAPPDGSTRSALCIDRESGRIVHDIKLFDVPKPLYTAIDFNSHASPSPVIEQGRVYVHFGAAGTACLDTESGKVLWKRTDLLCNHWRGPGASPILWEDLLILTFDGYDQQYVVALHRGDGSTAWKKDRVVDYKTDDGDLKKAFCTPAVFTIGGKVQLISPSAGGTTSYDPKTGKVLWKVNHPAKTMNVATPPLLGDGKVLVTTGNPATLVAIRPTGSGDVSDTHVAWTVRKLVSTRPAPLLLDGLVYMISDQGFASCLDLKGKEVWVKRLGGNFSSSPVCAGGHLYCFDQEGKGFVLATGRTPKIVATNRLDAGCMASPAIAGKALFVRTKTHLYRIEQK